MTRLRDTRGRFISNDPFDPRALFDTPQAPVRIPLSWPNLSALVDAEDYPLLNRVSWQTHTNDFGKQYAKTTMLIGGRKRAFYMHRIVACRVSLPPSHEHTVVDHVNGDGLLNTRRNLRWATPSENAINRNGGIVRQTDFLDRLVPLAPDDPDNPCTLVLRAISQLERG